MPQDKTGDFDAWLQSRKKEQKAPAPAQTGGDFDSWLREREAKTAKPAPTQPAKTQPKPPKSMAETFLELGMPPEDPAGYAKDGRGWRPRHRAFEQKPLLTQLRERAEGALTRGGGQMSKIARQTAGAAVGASEFLAGKPFRVVDFPEWRQAEEAKMRLLEEERRARPSSFATDVAEGIVEAAPVASAAILGTAATGGGLPAMMGIGGGLSAAAADWRDPKRAAAQTAIGAVAPVVGGAVGRGVGGAVASRLSRPVARAAAGAGGELIGGAAGNVAGTGAEQLAFEGQLNPRELARSGAVGAGLSAVGARSAARRYLPPGRVNGAIPMGASPLPTQRLLPPARLVAPESPLANRRLLPPGRPEDVPTEPLDARSTGQIPIPDAPTTQRMPVVTPEMIAAENAPTTPAALPVLRGNEPPFRQTREFARPERGPIRQTAERPIPAPRQPMAQPEQPLAARPVRPPLRTPQATPENITGLRGRREELSREAYDRRGEFTGDLRDEMRELGGRIAEFEHEQARQARGGRLEPAPPPGMRPERYAPPPEERAARRAALEPRTGPMPETLTPGRQVPQEVQGPRGLRTAESHVSREDARQGYFERFDDAELVDEIRRMEEIRNQDIRGRSRLTPEQLEANRFDLKIATEMQKERTRIQRQQGREAVERIEPRTPGRTYKEAEARAAEQVERPGVTGIEQTAAKYLENADRLQARLKRRGQTVGDEELTERTRADEVLRDLFQKEKQEGELFGDYLRRLSGRTDLKPKSLPFAEDFPRLRAIREDVAAKKAAEETPTGRKIPHSTVGEVSEAPDQSGVRKGQLRVLDSAGKAHIIRNPRIAGNREAAFVKREEAPKAEQPPQSIWAGNKATVLLAGREVHDLTITRVIKTPAGTQYEVGLGTGSTIQVPANQIVSVTPKQRQASAPTLTSEQEARLARDMEDIARNRKSDIAASISKLARTPSSPVEIAKLRAEFPQMSKADFDAEMARLNESGQIALHRHDYPQSLKEAERANLVKIGEDYFNAATLRESKGHIMGGIFGGLQPLFSKAKLPSRAEASETVGGAQAVAQLGNPRFVIRNILQHIAFGKQERTATRLAAAIDWAYSKTTGKGRQIAAPRGSDLASYVRNWQVAIRAHKAGRPLPGGYSPIQHGANANKIDKAIRGAMTWMNEIPDAANWQTRFEDSLQSIVRAAQRSGTPLNQSDAIAQATMEANRAALRDPNYVSKVAVKIKDLFNTASSPIFGTKKFGAGDFILKYAKTVGALTKRGIERSPLGLID